MRSLIGEKVDFEQPNKVNPKQRRLHTQVIKVAQIANSEKYTTPNAKSCGEFADTEAAKASMLLHSLFEEKEIAN